MVCFRFHVYSSSMTSFTRYCTGHYTYNPFMDTFINITIIKRPHPEQMLMPSTFILLNFSWENIIICSPSFSLHEYSIRTYIFSSYPFSLHSVQSWLGGIILDSMYMSHSFSVEDQDSLFLIQSIMMYIIVFHKAIMDNTLCSGIISLEHFGTIIVSNVYFINNKKGNEWAIYQLLVCFCLFSFTLTESTIQRIASIQRLNWILLPVNHWITITFHSTMNEPRISYSSSCGLNMVNCI